MIDNNITCLSVDLVISSPNILSIKMFKKIHKDVNDFFLAEKKDANV